MKTVLSALLVFLYNADILAATGWVVFIKGHSGWWFLVAIMLLASFKSTDD